MTINILHITTNPPGASIYTDTSSTDIEYMSYRGKSPLNANMYNGNRRVIVKMEGYEDFEQVVELIDGFYNNYLDITLIQVNEEPEDGDNNDDEPSVIDTNESSVPILPIALGAIALIAGIMVISKKKKL